MIEISNNKEKNLTFETQLSGVSPKDLTGYFRMYIDGIEYGFPAQITENSISIDIPSLKTIVSRPLREGEKFEARLELVGNDNYIKPWDDKIIIKSSVMVEAKLVDSKSSKKPMVQVVENKKQEHSKQKKVINESKPIKKSVDVTQEHLIQYMEKHGTKNKKIQEIMLERCTNKVGDDKKKIFAELYNYYKKDNK